MLEQHQDEQLSYGKDIDSSPAKIPVRSKKAIKKERKVEEDLLKVKQESKTPEPKHYVKKEASYERKRAISQVSDIQEARSPELLDLDITKRKDSMPYSLRSKH